MKDGCSTQELSELEVREKWEWISSLSSRSSRSRKDVPMSFFLDGDLGGFDFDCLVGLEMES